MDANVLLQNLANVLMTDRNFRDWGTRILLIGIAAESAIDIFWKEENRVIAWELCSRYAKTIDWLWRPRNWAAVTGLLLVLVGVRMEWSWGDKADDDADQIRITQQQRIEDLTRDESRLLHDAGRLVKVLQPRQLGTILNGSHALTRLKKFAGTQVYLQVIPEFEAETFEHQFSVLGAADWSIKFVDTRDTNLQPENISPGIRIWSHGSPFDVMKYWLPWQSPFDVEPRTASDKEWLAAQALRSYVKWNTGLDAFVVPLFDLSERVGASTFKLPPNSLFVTIGPRDVLSELLQGSLGTPSIWVQFTEDEAKAEESEP